MFCNAYDMMGKVHILEWAFHRVNGQHS